MARPPKYSDDLVSKIVNAISVGAPFIHACNYAGISFETFCQWRKSKPEFSEAIKNAEGKAVTGWLAKIEKAASDGNWQAAAWKLERRYPEDFGKRDRIQIDVNKLDSDIERELALVTAGSQIALAGEAESEAVH